jgi:hypothetical protein
MLWCSALTILPNILPMLGKPKGIRSVRDLSLICAVWSEDAMAGGPIPSMPKGFENIEFIMSFIWCMERMWDLKTYKKKYTKWQHTQIISPTAAWFDWILVLFHNAVSKLTHLMTVTYIILYPFLLGTKFLENAVKLKHVGILTNQNCTHEKMKTDNSSYCLMLVWNLVSHITGRIRMGGGVKIQAWNKGSKKKPYNSRSAFITKYAAH